MTAFSHTNTNPVPSLLVLSHRTGGSVPAAPGHKYQPNTKPSPAETSRCPWMPLPPTTSGVTNYHPPLLRALVSCCASSLLKPPAYPTHVLLPWLSWRGVRSRCVMLSLAVILLLVPIVLSGSCLGHGSITVASMPFLSSCINSRKVCITWEIIILGLNRPGVLKLYAYPLLWHNARGLVETSCVGTILRNLRWNRNHIALGDVLLTA